VLSEYMNSRILSLQTRKVVYLSSGSVPRRNISTESRVLTNSSRSLYDRRISHVVTTKIISITYFTLHQSLCVVNIVGNYSIQFGIGSVKLSSVSG